jgi:membrane-associated phospholipid phosphatase
MLFMVPVLVLPSILAGQATRRDLASAAWVTPGPSLSDSTVLTRPAAFSQFRPDRTAIRWYHGVAFLGTIAALSSLDEGTRNEIQSHRSAGKDDAAAVFRRMGQPEVYGVVALGTLATGVVVGNPRVTRAGERISAGLLLAGFTTSALKLTVGRQRPLVGEEQYVFHPFSSTDAFPSGHTTVAFALAASVSDEIHSTPVTIGLYSLATLTAWSRLNDNKHWLTDVLAGAAIGVTSAKLMNGHWRVFGISAPRFLLEPSGGAGLAWRVGF